MLKKSVMVVFLILISGAATIKSQTENNKVIDVILSAYSQRIYTSKPVTDSETDLIVKCGLKAPSARNLQPWMFTVVKTDSLIKAIMPEIISGNILIVISGLASEQPGMNNNFDCGLAAESMFIAAQVLGLGARLYGTGVKLVNSSMKQVLGIPEAYNAVILLRVGNVDKNVDATSSASTRKKQEELVIYR